jgi:hypothetical protein
VEYGSAIGTSGTSNYDGSCLLEDGEAIYRVEITTREKWNPMPIGLSFVTNVKRCTLGNNDHPDGTLHIVEGDRLLYITGRKGMVFDKLEFHFNNC